MTTFASSKYNYMKLNKHSEKAGIMQEHQITPTLVEVILKKLDAMEKTVTALQEEVMKSRRHPMDLYLSQEDVMKKFDICENTLRDWRDAGHISYFKRSRKILYTWDSIEKFIKSNLSIAFQYEER